MDLRKAIAIAALLLCPLSILVVLITGRITGAPGNVWVIVLSYLVGPVSFLYFFIPIVAFRALAQPLLRGRLRVGWWSLALFALVAVAAASYLSGSREFALQYQGEAAYTFGYVRERCDRSRSRGYCSAKPGGAFGGHESRFSLSPCAVVLSVCVPVPWRDVVIGRLTTRSS